MAPEVLEYLDSDVSADGYTDAVDMWGVGCIAYRLVTGKVPFRSAGHLMKYCQGSISFPSKTLQDCGADSLCSDFIEKLLSPSPGGRLSAEKALNDPWITDGKQTRL